MFKANQYDIGCDNPCFIIAEAGVNHNGNLEIARQLIKVAANAGTDAIKFQTFQAEKLATVDAPKADYQKKTTAKQESQYGMLCRLELSAEAHRDLIATCEEKGILFLSSPFDEQSADFLEELGVPAFKIPSGEITNLPFLQHIASKGKPLILSTGMASIGEVEAAVQTIRATGNPSLVLLHCVSNYPTDPVDVNLRAMQTMAAAFGVPVGFSDHTLGIEVALAAVALGACVIEKHFTLDRHLPGPDHQASLEPQELASLVQGIRKVEAALGHGRKEPAASEARIAAVARKSLVAIQDIKAGTILTEELIASRRPGTGIAPGMRSHLIGRTARCFIPAGTAIAWEMLA